MILQVTFDVGSLNTEALECSWVLVASKETKLSERREIYFF